MIRGYMRQDNAKQGKGGAAIGIMAILLHPQHPFAKKVKKNS